MVDSLINQPSAGRSAQALAAAGAYGGEVTAGIRQLLSRCPRHQTTPLVELDGLAAAMGVGAISVKDERDRLGLASFKALGGAFAVLAHAAGGDDPVAIEAVVQARGAGLDLVFATATAGNHGRSVAAGAQLVGCRCVIFVYDGVAADQIAAIAAHGAEIVHVPGVYEDAVATCRARAAEAGWQVVSDTSWPGYVEIPRRVMQGYTAIAAEVLEQATARPVTHLFVQAGVGGLACALAGHLASVLGDEAPRVVVVEPQSAACLFESARRGAPASVPYVAPTNMGRLECFEPSPVAWEVLGGLTAGFVTVSDAEAKAAAMAMADLGLATSPSGAAGLAGLTGVMRDPAAAAAFGLDGSSRVLVVATEQPTAVDRAAARQAAIG